MFQVAEDIKNEDFPEGSKRGAKNFCRNPKKKFIKPWCYGLDLYVENEVCDIPLCKNSSVF